MNRALTIGPLSRLFTEEAAMVPWKLRRYDEAMKGINKAAELDPEFAFLDLSRGVICEAATMGRGQ